jgi:uncharacterized MAPEG superfamily protein
MFLIQEDSVEVLCFEPVTISLAAELQFGFNNEALPSGGRAFLHGHRALRQNWAFENSLLVTAMTFVPGTTSHLVRE